MNKRSILSAAWLSDALALLILVFSVSVVVGMTLTGPGLQRTAVIQTIHSQPL
jgi:hypothetical protein